VYALTITPPGYPPTGQFSVDRPCQRQTRHCGGPRRIRPGWARLPYAGGVTAAHDYNDLHELIDRLEPEQAEELREHALRLERPTGGRFKVLRSFSGPRTDLGARAREIMRAEFGQGDADR
jgi:hypothetical protein